MVAVEVPELGLRAPGCRPEIENKPSFLMLPRRPLRLALNSVPSREVLQLTHSDIVPAQRWGHAGVWPKNDMLSLIWRIDNTIVNPSRDYPLPYADC